MSKEAKFWVKYFCVVGGVCLLITLATPWIVLGLTRYLQFVEHFR